MPEFNPYTIRPFTVKDTMAYKAVRLEALQREPGMFCSSYATEAAFTDEQWQGRIMGSNQSRFGLYYGEELIGITGIIIEDAAREEAYLTHSYIRKEHRGKGLSRLLYEARIAWAKERGIKRLLISHRASNTASMKANQKFGFRYTHKSSQTWPPDGTVEDLLHYELLL